MSCERLAELLPDIGMMRAGIAELLAQQRLLKISKNR